MEKILTKEEFLAQIETKPQTKKKEPKILFTELGRDMFKGNKHILNKYFKNEKGQDCYYANLLAFKDIKDIISLKELKDELKKDFGSEVNLKGYKYEPEHYMFATCTQQLEYEETAFKEAENEEISKYEGLGLEMLDFGAVEALYTALINAIKGRYVMIFNLEDAPSLINNALECQYLGVNCTASNSAIRYKVKEIKDLLENEDVIKWFKTGASDMYLDRYDYLDTYKRVLRQLTDIRNEPLEYLKDLIHNERDVLEDEIIANEYIETESYYENSLDNEDDYLD